MFLVKQKNTSQYCWQVQNTKTRQFQNSTHLKVVKKEAFSKVKPLFFVIKYFWLKRKILANIAGRYKIQKQDSFKIPHT